MTVQVYTFKITYRDCDSRIWRIAAVSSNYTLLETGYMVLATFDTRAYHRFKMKFRETEYFLSREDFEDLPNYNKKKCRLLRTHKIGQLDLKMGDVIEMTYDFGCMQKFDIELIEINDMPRGHGTAYPKIIDGAGRGIIDDMSAPELLEIIRKIDKDGHSGIHYSSYGFKSDPEWDYRNYYISCDKGLLKGKISIIRDRYRQ